MSSLLIRSELSVPAGNTRMVEKALASDVDAFFLDLEDSVAPGEKNAAREAAVTDLANLDWGTRERAVRINATDTPWCYQDILALVAVGTDRLVIPKVRSAGDVAFLDRLIDQASREMGKNGSVISYELQIEDAIGLGAIDAILAESARTAIVTFGQGDFAAAVGMPAAEIGVSDEWDKSVAGDRWMLPRQLIVFAAARRGIPALNGPYAAYKDDSGFRSYCRMSRALGFAGVWCIHPAQIAVANDVFSPTPEDVAHAQRIVDAMQGEWDAGRGAGSRDSVMTDEANVRMARRTLETANRIAGQQKTGSQ